MAELVITDNPDTEIAAVVDLDTFTTLPLVAAGPEREQILRAFIDAVPFDVDLLDHDTMRAAFAQFLARMGPTDVGLPATDNHDPLEPTTRDVRDAEASLAERGAADYAGTPEPAPADTDVEADARPETITVRCFNCEGAGTINFGDGSEPQTCNLCKGTGRREEVVMR